MKPTVIILTLNAEKTISLILSKIDLEKYNIVIIDSSSNDKTLDICRKYDCYIKTIPKSNFNHGATREMARKLIDSDIVVFLTQDAISFNRETIGKLIKPIREGKASASYARQILHQNAGIFESFPRLFNYGDKAQIRSIKDIHKYGVYTFFCPNSCAAWLSSALDEIGGFKPTLTNEDYFACAELLLKGYKVAYVADAIVKHSHNYSLADEFRRMFDTGYVRAERPWIQDAVGNAENRGKAYFLALIKKLYKENCLLVPYAIIQTAMKYLGYKIGFNALKFPKWIKKFLSGQDYYWYSKYYQG
ncbi:MAG: glycosyltransferase [Candidatus Marinimicrobia bacterium]|nr:glycosyltransferase [Candidatus Neomarinimicrobiota bacterium]